MELSVVIAAYNRERTVGATIASALGCGADVEVIVVDDGSADRTAAVAAVFGPRVRVVTQPNGGPAVARNTGIKHSTAPVVAFLDSDDRWEPGVVPACLSALRDHPDIDVVFCETLFGNPADGYQTLSPVTGRGRFPELLTDPLGPGLFRLPRDRFVRMMIDRNQVFLGSALFRRTALDAGGGFDPARFGGEDYELCLRYSATHRFAFCPRPLARYEKHPGGLSANPDRMAREFALATRTFSRLPGLKAGERRQARARYRRLAFEYGYLAYDRGDHAEARRRFAAALTTGGGSPRTAAFWAACHLPAPLVRVLRRLKQGAR
jgi:glycosyltransferase involved in cell wall biosynthesis